MLANCVALKANIVNLEQEQSVLTMFIFCALFPFLPSGQVPNQSLVLKCGYCDYVCPSQI